MAQVRQVAQAALNNNMDRSWGRIGWFYALGVLAAAQLGKMSALVPLITVEFAVGLTVAGVLISLLEIGGATLGFVAGLFVDRLGARRVLLTGMGVFALTGVGESLASSVAALLGLRLLEGVAYLCVVVAAPLLIFRSAPPGREAVALALWSSFVPVGFALGATTSGWIADAVSWRAATLVWAVLAALMMLLSFRMTLPHAAADADTVRRRLSLPRRSIWALTLAFGCYASFAVGLIALLPTFLVAQTGASARQAGLIGGLCAFISVLGVLIAARLRHRGGNHTVWIVVAIVLPAVLLFAVFAEGASLARVTVLMLVLNTISGVYAGLAFALLPTLARSDHEMAVANGLTLQFGATGSLLGPPMFAACVERWGWTGAAVAGALVSTACLLLMSWARLEDPSAAPPLRTPV